MSDLTKLLRSNPITGAILDEVEKVEGEAQTAIVHVAIPTAVAAITAAANSALTGALGAGATLAEPDVDKLIASFGTWLAGFL